MWAVIWCAIYRDPTKHPRANEQERQYLLENSARIDETDDSEAAQIKWCTLFQRGADVTRIRKIVMVGGLLGDSVIFFAAMAPSVYLAPSSHHVGSIGGIQNFASNIAGIISPFIMGWLLDVDNGNYSPSFAVAGVVALVGAATYAFIVGRAEPLPILPPRGSK